MMYRLLGATAMLMGIAGQDVASLKNELARMKGQLAGSQQAKQTVAASGGGSQDSQQSTTEEKDDGKYPKDMYQGSADGDYQKYMDKYGKSGQGGDYQQYMKKYAGGKGGDYQQYMKKYDGGQGGDYQQYMKKYDGGQGGDYQQYMKKYAGGQGGDYQQYMKKYPGGQGNQQGATSSIELIEKAPTKASSDSSDTLNLAATDSKDASSTDSQGNYQQYMDKYAGSYEKYMKQYAGDYQKYQNYQQFKDCGKSGDSKIASAKDAKNQQELQEWKLGALKKVQCFVPDDYSSYASQTVDKQYNSRLAELNNAGATTQSTQGSNSPFEAEDATELMESPNIAEKIVMPAKTFLAKSEAEDNSEIAQSEAGANLKLFTEEVKSDPMTIVGACSLGVAVACFLFFTVFKRSVQQPLAQLG